MAYINYRENNPLYSPGLSTYTTQAEKGDTGQSGLSVYYNDGIITDNKSEEDRVVQNILSGSILSSSDASGDSVSYKTFSERFKLSDTPCLLILSSSAISDNDKLSS